MKSCNPLTVGSLTHNCSKYRRKSHYITITFVCSSAIADFFYFIIVIIVITIASDTIYTKAKRQEYGCEQTITVCSVRYVQILLINIHRMKYVCWNNYFVQQKPTEKNDSGFCLFDCLAHTCVCSVQHQKGNSLNGYG